MAKLPTINRVAPRFVFSWRATLLTLPVLALLLGLGTWQLQRAVWKQGLLTKIEQQQQKSPLTQLPMRASEDLNYRRATLTGMIDRNAAYKLWPRTYKEQVGYHWLVPMVVAVAEGQTDAPQGLLVLVNLGWVPKDYVPENYSEPQVESIAGTLRLPAAPTEFTPENPKQGAEIYWLDLETIGKRLGAPIFPYVFEADAMGPNPPIGGQTVLSLPNNHQQYAITWFVLALAVLVIYVLASRRSE